MLFQRLTLTIILTIFLPMLLASKEALLKLNTNGHTSVIRAMDTSSDGKYIVSAGDDKTIRVWDRYSGNELRKMGGHVGSGSEGQVYALALSPDDKYLAVAGWLSLNGNGYGDIRIYDFHTGKLIKVLQSHTSVIYDLDFSEDGRYLLSVSVDKSAKIWDMDRLYLKATLSGHHDTVGGGAIFKDGNEAYKIITLGDDKKAILSRFNPRSGRVEKLKTFSYKSIVETVAVNEEHIAITSDTGELLIFDHDLQKIQEVKTTYAPIGLDYSPNGRYLLAGSSSDSASEVVAVYDSYENYKLKKTLRKHTSSVFTVAFLTNDLAVSAGGDHKEIFVWDIHSGSVDKEIKGVGDVIWSVGIKGDSVAWGHKFDTKTDYHKMQSSFSHSFNLKTMQVSRDTYGFNRAQTSQGPYRLQHARGGKYGSSDAVLNIYKNGSKTGSITKTSSTGYSHRCYGMYKDYIISGGGNGALMVYDIYGKRIADLIGHNGSIWSISVDGDRLVSGSDDQTIRVWNLKELGQKSVIRPMLNIFVATNEEYIVWSKSGFYDASVGGDRYVGYHINQGRYKESRFVGSDRFYATNYRPDLIANILALGSEEKAIRSTSRIKKVKTVDVAQSLPPEVILLSDDTIKTSQESVTIEFMILNAGIKIEEVIVTLNGRKTKTRGLRKKKISKGEIRTVTVTLEEGQNIVEIMAKNEYALSDPITVKIERKVTKKNLYKPDLYLLSIGVSEYKNKSYNLGVADKDAQAISRLFKKQKGKVYNHVEVKTLTNSNATKDNILDALDWLNTQATQRDVAVIFIAGHGVNDDYGKYYFLNYESNLERLRRTALKWIEFEDTLNNLPSKVILLADTCHSGNITGVRRDMTSAIKSIVNSGTGQVIMTATTGNGYSYEQKSWGHGAFTKALIEGLEDHQADYDEDRSVSIKELDLYVTKRVKILTKGKQKPTTIIPSSIPDFAIVHR